MIEKQSFLDRLNMALLDRGVTEADIRPYLERFDRFYDRMLHDSDQVNADVLSDIDHIADNIAAQISERYDEINRFAERTMTLRQVEPDESAEEYELVEEAPTGLVSTPTDIATSDQAEEPEEESSASRLPDYIDEEPTPNSTMFWVLFAVSLPVTIPLALLALGVFLGVWSGLFALILGAVAALIVLVAAGSALSLVGIVYGAIQLFQTTAIGLYEIGMGILIAGTVMFFGILLYNFAVRLMPFVIRMVGKLFWYLFGQLRVLFRYLKKECAKL